jgi:hypothetical protein
VLPVRGPPDSTADTDDGGIRVPSEPDDGALSDTDGCAAATVVSVIPAPHVEVTSVLVLSPL